MTAKRMITAAIVGAVLLIGTMASAQEKAFVIQESDDIQAVLLPYMGKRIIIGLDAGQEMTGTLKKVGDHLIQLSAPAGKEFFDAMIRIDRITSVMVRVRDK